MESRDHHPGQAAQLGPWVSGSRRWKPASKQSRVNTAAKNPVGLSLQLPAASVCGPDRNFEIRQSMQSPQSIRIVFHPAWQ